MKTLPAFAASSLAALLAACASMSREPATVTSRPFGVARSGFPATLWTLRAEGIEVDVTDHGATLVAVRVPDRAGRMADVCLGFDDVSGYESAANQYFGCTVGRVCNRIANAEFVLDGYTYRLAKNDGPNHLHGGASRSFDKVRWRAEVVGDHPTKGVRFTYTSPDGEEGYPGNLHVAVTYWVGMPGPRLAIQYEAETDRRTPVNLTNHAYWNLGGQGSPTVLDHELWLAASAYTPVDETLIPTGQIAPVAGTPLDFSEPTRIGLRIDSLTATSAKGYDHNFVLDGEPGESRRAAVLRDPASGRTLTVETTEPGLQFYSGNFLHGQRGKGGAVYAHRSALCLETQHFPDSVHHARFPSTILEPGQHYASRTQLHFGVE